MTREVERPPFNASPVRQTSRLVIRKPIEPRTTTFNHSPSSARNSLGRGFTSLKGSITLSGSLRVRSPRAQRPTILPPKQEASTQTLDNETNVENISPSSRLHTEIRYNAEEIPQIKFSEPPVTSPTKTVRFAADTSEIERDPAIIYCAAKPTKE